jgi:hypothetical protein
MVQPTSMYANAFKRLNSENAYVKVDTSFKKYMLEVIEDLCEKHRSDKITQYWVSHSSHRSYCGILLKNIRVKASSKYELWLKLYRYIQENKDARYEHEYDQRSFDYSFCIEYGKTGDDYLSMVKSIDNAIFEMEYINRPPAHVPALYWCEDLDPIIYV